MPKNNKYRPNYRKLYPSVELTSEVLDCLIKSDRKLEYSMIDLKTERFEVDAEKQKTIFHPSREDSYDRLIEDEKHQFSDGAEPLEDIVVRLDEIRRMREALLLLRPQEQELIKALYFDGLSERQLSATTGIPQRTINDRRNRILSKLKKLMEK